MDAGGDGNAEVITWLRGEGEPHLEHLISEKGCLLVTRPLASIPEYSVRKGWFLNATEQERQVVFVPSESRSPPAINLDRPTVSFKGWPSLSKNWVLWVDKLEPIHGQAWRRLGIYDAVLATTYKLHKYPHLILGAACFWNDLTNTFVFPWGEATVTLEDVMILGGLPVAGEPLAPVMRRARAIVGTQDDPLERQILIERKKVCRGSTTKKAEFGAWVKHFIDVLEDDVEHAAFLALWLSRFVFPVESPAYTVRMETIPVAIRLARGTRVGLAPSILASLYRDLRILKGHVLQAMDPRNACSPLVLWAPFHLLQLWLWERFKALRPDDEDQAVASMPRMAKWNNCCNYMKPETLMSILVCPTEFLWRPYAYDPGNRRPQTFYSDVGRWFRTPRTVDGDDEFEPAVELISFGMCLKGTPLEGIDCVEAYSPHRVAMQFGYDQDIPGIDYNKPEPPRHPSENAMEGVELYITPRLHRPKVTLRYANWWINDMMACLPRQIIYDSPVKPRGGAGAGGSSGVRLHHLFDPNRAASRCPSACAHCRFSGGASSSRTPHK